MCIGKANNMTAKRSSILSTIEMLEEFLFWDASIHVNINSNIKPVSENQVAFLSVARENNTPLCNNLTKYFKERSGIFISSALIWSTLSHHNSRRSTISNY